MEKKPLGLHYFIKFFFLLLHIYLIPPQGTQTLQGRSDQIPELALLILNNLMGRRKTVGLPLGYF